jgi:hypothetical protein
MRTQKAGRFPLPNHEAGVKNTGSFWKQSCSGLILLGFIVAMIFLVFKLLAWTKAQNCL